MKVLLRIWHNEYYVWKDAQYENEQYYVGGDRINETSILAVKDHDIGRLVKCKYCGATIKDDPESIEKHYADEEAKRDCLSCRYLAERVGRFDKPDKQYKKNDNGTYSIVSTYCASLICTQYYDNFGIDTDEAKRNCVHNLHRARGVRPYGGMLIKFPDLFEKQITVDALNKRGFKYKEYDGWYFQYDLKCRNTLFACANEHGIIDHFSLHTRYDRFRLYYSATQKKLLFQSGGRYVEGIPEGVTESKYTTIKNKIESLYEEA